MSEYWQWMADRLGVTVSDAGGTGSIRDLIGMAVRRNPRRAHLLVSTVLGKHLPADPRAVYQAASQLGDLIAARLDREPAVVLGFAETATGLGHVVADRCRSGYVHSTRRAVAGIEPAARFDEDHSHASRHLLLPEHPALLDNGHVLVLVDDELSTGRTAVNAITQLHADYPRERYIVAALVDVRGDGDRRWIDVVAQRLGVQIDSVSIAQGRVHLPESLAPAVTDLLAANPPPAAASTRAASATARVDTWPREVRDGGRHGFGPDDRAGVLQAARVCAAELARRGLGERVLVLATEELMYAPLMIGIALADILPASQVRFSSTTRSPVLALDEPGYPIRTQLVFVSHDDPSDGPGERYAYNVAPRADGDAFTDVAVVVDGVGDTNDLHAPDGLLAALARTGARVHLVVVPSYRPAVTVRQ
jgi:pyrimidine operon attenuation protein/uracil phosphoribosyltransferase